MEKEEEIKKLITTAQIYLATSSLLKELNCMGVSHHLTESKLRIQMEGENFIRLFSKGYDIKRVEDYSDIPIELTYEFESAVFFTNITFDFAMKHDIIEIRINPNKVVQIKPIEELEEVAEIKEVEEIINETETLD